MTNSFMDTITEPVFLADSAIALERAIELLDAHGIAFTANRAGFADPRFAGEVREGTAFYVLVRQAEFCREMLTSNGLGRGVLAAGVSAVVRERELTFA